MADLNPIQQAMNDASMAISQSAAADDAASDEAHEHDMVPMRAVDVKRLKYDVLKYIPEEAATHYKIVPLALVEGALEVGMVEPESLQAVDALNFIAKKTGVPFKIFKITTEDFEKVRAAYRGLGGDVDRALIEFGSDEKSKDKDEFLAEEGRIDLNLTKSGESISFGKGGKEGLNIQEDAPAIKLVSTILRYAIDGGASDVHIEPTNQGVRVRYRVDGILHTSVVLPLETHRAIVARVKVLASIRLDERRKPQDGRFSATIDQRQIDFRVSTFPAYNGEKIVIRILDREQGFIPLDDLGFSKEALDSIRAAIKKPYGIILISGPTGSGKSTTLYSMLSEIDRETKNVLSLEDPIEYYVDGVNQSQVRPEIGYTFANGLRTTLRQDPNVIMVGEIRDGETAKLAIQAALTGHLVLSTIHTNSAIGTIPRLVDMGVEPYLIPPTLVLSMAQRLTRKLCPDSADTQPMTPSLKNMLNEQFATLPKERRPQIPDVVTEAKRTAACPNGTRGRLAVFEVMEMTPQMEKVILTSPVESQLWEVARKQGMYTMKEDAIFKSFAGKIPFAEVNLLGGLLLGEEEPPAAPKAPEEPLLETAEPEKESEQPPAPSEPIKL